MILCNLFQLEISTINLNLKKWKKYFNTSSSICY